MYLKSGLGFLRSTYKELFAVSKNLNNNKLLSWGGVKTIFDELYCLFVYGCIFTEYQAFGFNNRSKENRKSFVTVIWLLKLLEKYNPYEHRDLFHDKNQFNATFNDFLGRDWLKIVSSTKDETINSFISKHERVVLKYSMGASGKQVYVSDKSDSTEFLIHKIRSENFNLIEEAIENCPSIKNLNPTSLNTLRIVTVRHNAYFKVICACLRIGAVGSTVDNVSQGGVSARIDVANGTINSIFCANAYRAKSNSQNGKDIMGFKIPQWEDIIQYVEEASKLIPEIKFVGWDVAITDKGPAIVEGNESFHTGVMQFYASPTEKGIKDDFLEAIKYIQNDNDDN